MGNKNNMFDIEDENKKLILRSVYFSVLQDEWKHHIYKTISNNEEKKIILGKMPCGGDPLSNLMKLASRLLPNFDRSKSTNENIGLIKKFIIEK